MLQRCGAVELQRVGRAGISGAGLQGVHVMEQCRVHDVMAVHVACCNRVSELAVKGFKCGWILCHMIGNVVAHCNWRCRLASFMCGLNTAVDQ